MKEKSTHQLRQRHNELWDRLIGYTPDTEYANELAELLLIEHELAKREDI